jgi:hypothetical protein
VALSGFLRQTTTKTGRHDTAESGIKLKKSINHNKDIFCDAQFFLKDSNISG